MLLGGEAVWGQAYQKRDGKNQKSLAVVENVRRSSLGESLRPNAINVYLSQCGLSILWLIADTDLDSRGQIS